ncbi:hypothetical protein M407DRAFT_11051 [Tulasnella calospora MUT 4182]|uniref:Uncharacterized protein n=1 Tax=Tulasnella calospora MUT 4182 TaxID=1051891 RepID=A0A0C3LFD8_9AGAM|nr:hypothetical protein M407DRAFT_11051 [Tulasnella calospora MUT 4182]
MRICAVSFDLDVGGGDGAPYQEEVRWKVTREEREDGKENRSESIFRHASASAQTTFVDRTPFDVAGMHYITRSLFAQKSINPKWLTEIKILWPSRQRGEGVERDPGANAPIAFMSHMHGIGGQSDLDKNTKPETHDAARYEAPLPTPPSEPQPLPLEQLELQKRKEVVAAIAARLVASIANSAAQPSTQTPKSVASDRKSNRRTEISFPPPQPQTREDADARRLGKSDISLAFVPPPAPNFALASGTAA